MHLIYLLIMDIQTIHHHLEFPNRLITVFCVYQRIHDIFQFIVYIYVYFIDIIPLGIFGVYEIHTTDESREIGIILEQYDIIVHYIRHVFYIGI